MFILQTAIEDAFLNISTGTPLAPAIFPPNSLHVATAFWSTADAPWRTIGKPGNLLWISSSISNLNLASPLNLKAPWEVPIAIANESTPVLSTNSTASAGWVYLWTSEVTSSSVPARTPSSASTTTPLECAYSTASLVILTFSSKSKWEPSIITEEKPASIQVLIASIFGPWSKWRATSTPISSEAALTISTNVWGPAYLTADIEACIIT